ncbi:MAG: hypothetical protein AUJ53_03520 [Flavobacteriaceae bacterium CG1_02_35_72]|nr:MAG: hypothetical protein AUJ53_03520 [Flavobacteriaceae bacterium CG1_02_35_72]
MVAFLNSPEIKQFIRKNSHLFWDSPEDKKEAIGQELLVETILNYGDMKAVLKLFHLMGIKEVAKIFFDSITTNDRRKGNYQELTINHFTLIFRKEAH